MTDIYSPGASFLTARDTEILAVVNLSVACFLSKYRTGEQTGMCNYSLKCYKPRGIYDKSDMDFAVDAGCIASKGRSRT